MNSENMLRERSQSPRLTYDVISFIGKSRVTKSTEEENRWLAAWGTKGWMKSRGDS